MKDGFHQVPVKLENRNLKAMSTTKGIYVLKMMPMGLKNAPAIFQRIKEHVLKDLPFAGKYIDDVIIGSTGATLEEAVENHFQDLVKVLETLKAADIVVSTKKIQLFMKEIYICWHILS